MTAQSSRVPPPAARRPARRQRLLLSCAATALATVALPAERAQAQAFQGNETVVTGSAVRTITGDFTETITVGTPTATINWSPYDTTGTGTIDFLPAGNTATFTNNPGSTADFTVLNRIIPTDPSRPVSFNGTVISQLQDLSQNVTQGGSVWFYSAGGIVVGSTAVFDVGSLLLTTNDVTSFGTDANGFTGRFLATPGSSSAITIAPGAQINATPDNSYVALVAPRIEQGGAVRVNGTAAFVAGEDVTMTMNQGLFDIQVDVGTGDGNGIVHSGSTGGPSSSAAGDYHRVYMVAVPKNQALTMLLGGSVGFDAATSASIENGAIVLSAGLDMAETPTGVEVGLSGTYNGAIDIDSGTYTSDLFAQAQGNISAIAGESSITFSGDVDLLSIFSGGSGLITVGAEFGGDLTIGGNLIANSVRAVGPAQALLFADSGGDVTIGGSASLFANPSGSGSGVATMRADDGSISITGAASVSTNRGYGAAGSTTASSDATGGSSTVVATNNGTITAGSLLVSANGSGQDNAGGGDTIGGDGHGGFAEVRADSGSTVTVGDDLTVTAQGFGGGMQVGATQGGNGYGGSAEVSTSGGTISVGGDLGVYAEGFGGGVLASAPGQLLGGDGIGGTAVLSASGGTVTVTGASLVSTYAIGGANAGGDGGDGEGGFTYVEAMNGGSLAFGAGGLFVSSTGVGGDGGTLGGFGFGGSSYVSLDGGDLSSAGMLQIWSNGLGGSGATGGDGEGGWSEIDIWSGGGALSAVGETWVQAAGTGGDGSVNAGGTGGTGGDGWGGSASIWVASVLEAEATASIELGRAFVNGNATGGAGGAGATGGAGGGAFGGDGEFYLGSSTADFTELQVYATTRGGAGGAGSAGAGGAGGFAEGGFAWIDVEGTLTADTFSSYSRAFGGDGGSGTTMAGAGGDAFGGSANIEVFDGGTITTTGLADIATTAFGGSGSTGGLASGGNSQFWIEGTLTAASLRVHSTATGGAGSAGDGGAATGGSSAVGISGGSVTVTDNTDVLANAIGGDGTANGGAATGGAAHLYSSSAASGSLANTRFEASGEGGAGGVGGTAGTGAGGIAFFELFDTTLTVGNLALTANGDTTGGIALIELLGSSLTANSVAMTANGGQSGGFAYTYLDNGDLEQPSQLDTDAFTAQANGGTTGGFIYLFVNDGSSAYLGNAALTATGADGSGGIFIDSVELDSETANASGGPIAAPGDPGISADNFTAESSGGILIANDLAVAESLSLTADASITTENLTAGDTITINAGGNFDLQDVTAGDSATFSAGGVASFHGTVSAPAITVTSADLNITGDLGVQGVTETIVLNAVSDGEPIVIGGPAEAEGSLGQDGLQWRLTGDESLDADSIVINAIGNNEGQTPDVLLLDVEIEGSQTAGGGTSHVELNTAGSVLVEGLVLFLDSGADDVLAINAGDSIQINTSTGGGIGMVGPGETPAGTLLLTASDIWSGDQALLDALNADPSFAGRNDALTNNPGADDQRGRIVAGGIEMTVGNSLFVQNTGTAAFPAGINVGAGGLVVRSSSPGTTVFAFGQGINADGSPLTGEAFADAVDFQSGEGSFTAESRFNGCALNGPCADPGPGPGPEPEPEPVPPTITGPENILGPVEVIESGAGTGTESESESEGEGSLSVTLASALFETGDVVLDQLIDEGVTSGGDSSLWFGGDDDDDEDEDEDDDDDGEDK